MHCAKKLNSGKTLVSKLKKLAFATLTLLLLIPMVVCFAHLFALDAGYKLIIPPAVGLTYRVAAFVATFAFSLYIGYTTRPSSKARYGYFERRLTFYGSLSALGVTIFLFLGCMVVGPDNVTLTIDFFMPMLMLAGLICGDKVASSR